MKVVSFIPIKLNNVRLPGKNLMLLNNRPLCDYLFQTINSIDLIDEKYVFCSDNKITEYMPDSMIFLERDSRLNGDEVKGIEIYDSFIDKVDADIYILTHVTGPFLKTSSIETAINKILYEGYDSAFTVKEINEFCWYDGAPVNYSLSDVVLTQNLKPVYVETSGFYMFTRNVLEKYRRRIGENPYMHIVDAFEAIDIDTAEDFAVAEVTARYLYGEE